MVTLSGDFWNEKWKSGDIGFHQNSYNPSLLKYWDDFTGINSGGVLVPLCGKSLDMVFFKEKGHDVYGAELSQLAIKSFFSENQLKYTRVGTSYQGENITLYHGDILKLRKNDFGRIQFIYDRASLVALDEKMRLLYVNWIRENFPHASIFLEFYEFDNEEIGPPYSIGDRLIEDYFGSHYKIEKKLSFEPGIEKIDRHKGLISYFKIKLNYLSPK